MVLCTLSHSFIIPCKTLIPDRETVFKVTTYEYFIYVSEVSLKYPKALESSKNPQFMAGTFHNLIKMFMKLEIICHGQGNDETTLW